jgi:tetrahydromethanopterin S-methyltransferase subunit G
MAGDPPEESRTRRLPPEDRRDEREREVIVTAGRRSGSGVGLVVGIVLLVLILMIVLALVYFVRGSGDLTDRFPEEIRVEFEDDTDQVDPDPEDEPEDEAEPVEDDPEDGSAGDGG